MGPDSSQAQECLRAKRARAGEDTFLEVTGLDNKILQDTVTHNLQGFRIHGQGLNESLQ